MKVIVVAKKENQCYLYFKAVVHSRNLISKVAQARINFLYLTGP